MKYTSNDYEALWKMALEYTKDDDSDWAVWLRGITRDAYLHYLLYNVKLPESMKRK